MAMDPSKLKPFDLEAAKAGKPFTHEEDVPPTSGSSRRFLGVRQSGDIAYELITKGGHGNPVMLSAPASDLRMLPEVKKHRIILFRQPNGKIFSCNSSEDNYQWVRRKGYPLIKEFEVEYEE